MMPVPYVGLSSLPRDPVALDRYLAGLPLRGWGPAPVRVFQVIEDLLITYGMPPALTAGLYRALGKAGQIVGGVAILKTALVSGTGILP